MYRSGTRHNYKHIIHTYDLNTYLIKKYDHVMYKKMTDQLSLGWWQQHPHQNYPWPLPPPAVIKKRKLGYNSVNTAHNCLTTWLRQARLKCKHVHSINYCTCSKEVGCKDGGLWVKEVAGQGPEEVERSFRADLLDLSVPSSTWASGGGKYFLIQVCMNMTDAVF